MKISIKNSYISLTFKAIPDTAQIDLMNEDIYIFFSFCKWLVQENP